VSPPNSRHIIGEDDMSPRKQSYTREKVIEEYHAERIRRGVEFGFCFCGCGEQTTIADGSDFNYGVAIGFPRRFVCGHHCRLSGKEYEIRDCGYKTPCWVWLRGSTIGKYKLRYGIARRPGETTPISAQRLMWERHRGPVPTGLDLDHLCRNTICCNPDHIEPVTHRVNVRRGKNTRLSMEIAREIRRLHAEDGLYYRVIAERYGVCTTHIQKICEGKKWPEDQLPILEVGVGK
jgi:HNH endonuclease